MAGLGWFERLPRWLNNLLWPGDYDRDSAKQAYRTYLTSKEVEKLDTAMEMFQLAIGQYRKHKNSSLVPTLINYSIVVRRHYDDCGRSPEDLDEVICLNTEAYNSWSGQKDADAFVVLLSILADAYFERYQRTFEPSPIRRQERQQAFDKAVRYYTEFKDNHTAGSQRSAVQIQLGVIFRTRCELEQTLDGFEVAVQYLQGALLETNNAETLVDDANEDDKKQRRKAAIDDIKATCLLNLADSYEVRYKLLQDPRNIHDLSIAIDYTTRAKALLQDLRRPELLACTYDQVRRHWLRWRQTNDQDDYNTVVKMAKAAKRDRNLDDHLEMSLNHILLLLGPAEFGDGQIDASRDLAIPKRRGVVVSVDVGVPR